jgi:hypothetical protein
MSGWDGLERPSGRRCRGSGQPSATDTRTFDTPRPILHFKWVSMKVFAELVHHCIAHPILFWTRDARWVVRLHDVSARIA